MVDINQLGGCLEVVGEWLGNEGDGWGGRRMIGLGSGEGEGGGGGASGDWGGGGG